MKRFLPVVFFVLFALQFAWYVPEVFAQSPPPTTSPSPSPAGGGSAPINNLSNDSWVVDADVTFAGKVVARSRDFVDWAILHPQWYFLDSSTSSSSLTTFWVTIRNIIYAFFGLFILITAFILIVTRGRNITVMKFIPRFVGIILLVTFSFAIVQFLYQVTDIFQGFFLTSGGKPIGIHNLITIGFDYSSFVGYRQAGPQFDESVFISLFLTKLTAMTLYVMAGVLFVRKVILWFFICISPVFPILWFYSPIRNTGKMWMGEFFKWLLYGPLFALFLDGLVFLWGSTIFSGIHPDMANPSYPTATNLLLGGPGQAVQFGNSVNVPETFVLYLLSLIMLWSAIILPFVLLQIFLDFFKETALSEGSSVRQIINMITNPLLKPPLASIPVSPPPSVPPKMPPPASTGMARELPMMNKIFNTQSVASNVFTTQSVNRPVMTSTSSPISTNINRPVATTISNQYNQSASNQYNQSARVATQQFSAANNSILNLTNLSVPTMRDVARYETTMISKDVEKHQEVTRVKETLDRISNPKTVTAPAEREKFIMARDQLVVEKQKGNPLAAAILTASDAAVPVSHSPTTELQRVVTASQPALPVVNRVQTVSLEDYEAVRKMWQENYQKLEPPKTSENEQVSRKDWVKKDIQRVAQSIDLLSSPDQVKQKEGMSMVGAILPFLLIGGFSQTEVIAYLKAKQEAAKSTLADLDKKEEEENTTLDRSAEKKEELKVMHQEAELELKPEEESPIASVGNIIEPLKDLSDSGDNK